jgi:hypothetical protein
MNDAVRLPSERKPLGELPFGIARRLILDASKTPGWARGGGPHFVAAETVAVASAPAQGTG